jgi:hypothetical protein
VKRSWLIPVAIFFVASLTRADESLSPNCALHFASATEAAELLSRNDEFLQRLSPFDRAARLKTDEPVDSNRFRDFVGSSAMKWSEAERKKILDAVKTLRTGLAPLSLPLPKTVTFIKTSGAEEGSAFYTRGTAVIFPQSVLNNPPPDRLQKTIAHELFHVISRGNSDLREKCYRIIGFTRCSEPTLPRALDIRRITNPDAPRNDHSIRVRHANKEVDVVPVLIASSDHYDMKQRGEFFEYLQLKFLVRTTNELLDPTTTTGFFEQVGRNTDYVIHPEEILAENFALLVTDAKAVPSPEILQRLRDVFTVR